MNKIIHHPDGYLVINGEQFPLSLVKEAIPEYTLDPPFISRVYVQGDYHAVSTDCSQSQGEFPWVLGDTLFHKVEYLRLLQESKKPKEVEKKVDPRSLKEKVAVAKELKGHAKLLEMGSFGNVWIRKQTYPTPETIHDGHKHKHDHVSLVIGKFLLEVEGQEPVTIKGPTFITIDKDKKHKFTSLVKNSTVFCVYAVRDKDGNLTDEYHGDNSPYM